MKKQEKAINGVKQLITPVQDLHKKINGVEVTLEELESLCTNFGRRPRGCSTFTSTGDTDDLLF